MSKFNVGDKLVIKDDVDTCALWGIMRRDGYVEVESVRGNCAIVDPNLIPCRSCYGNQYKFKDYIDEGDSYFCSHIEDDLEPYTQFKKPKKFKINNNERR